MERCPGNEIMQVQMWFSAIAQDKKSFNNHQCWEVVKNEVDIIHYLHVLASSCLLIGESVVKQLV
ncbi:unnamed protein product [Prunus armeniaca]